MRQNTRVTFAMRDLDRLKCIQAVLDGDLKLIRAAERLGLTTRQVRRLARRYAAGGPVRLVSKRFNPEALSKISPVLLGKSSPQCQQHRWMQELLPALPSDCAAMDLEGDPRREANFSTRQHQSS